MYYKLPLIAHRLLHIAYRIPLILLCFLFFGCGKKDNSGLSVADIKNPITADGMDEQQEATMPKFQFETLEYNFGKVIQGELLRYTFRFKNVGKSSLLISDVQASCGCTTSTPPKAPIRPGEKGEITVAFDSKHKSGEVSSYLVVTANTYPAQTLLTINANVVNP